MHKQSDSLVQKLPTIEEVESELARHSREARLLRTLRKMLRKKHDCERASIILQTDGGCNDVQ